MGGRDMKNKESIVPGPGSYDPSIEILFESFPKYKIGRSKRVFNEFNKITPGPGSYSLSLSENSPKTVFGTSKRDPSPPITSCSPGPGAYSPGLIRTVQSSV